MGDQSDQFHYLIWVGVVVSANLNYKKNDMGWLGLLHLKKIVILIQCTKFAPIVSPLISSLQVDTMGKECLKKQKHLYYFKGSVLSPFRDGWWPSHN